MAEIVAVFSKKGGTGKTSSALALASGLRLRGYHVLAIDLDSQQNLTYISKAERDRPTSYDLIMGQVEAMDAIQTVDACDFIPGSNALDALDVRIEGVERETRLKRALAPIKKDFDFVILDLPPGFGTVGLNALTAANGVIIPIMLDVVSMIGLNPLKEIVKSIRDVTNSELRIYGLLVTRFNSRLAISHSLLDVFNNIASDLHTKVFKTKIRESVAIREAQLERIDIFSYASGKRSKGVKDYSDFCDEFLTSIGKGKK